MRAFFLFFGLIVLCSRGFTQTSKSIDLRYCYEQARRAHPLADRKGLLREGSRLRQEQIDAGTLPEIHLQSQAQIQSETVDLPLEIPGMDDPVDLPLYSLQSNLELNYQLYDGGLSEARQELETSGLQVQEQEVDVALDRLKERVNRYYFGILSLQVREDILQTNLRNIRNRLRSLRAGVEHGTVLPGQVDQLSVEALRLEADIEAIRSEAGALLRALGRFIEQPLDDSTQLERVALEGFKNGPEIRRAELELFVLQKQEILSRESLITAQWKPKVGAQVRAGLGYPNPLNFFEDELSPFATAGLQFSWPLIDWKQADRDRQLLQVQNALVDNQRRDFVRDIELREIELNERIETLRSRIEREREIVKLQRQILQQAAAQLERGVLTSAEYLEQVNAAIQAELSLEYNRLQLEQTQVNYLTIKGLW